MQSSIIASSPFRSFSSVLYIAHLRPSFSDCFCLSFPQFLEDMLGNTHRPRGLVDGGAACLSVCSICLCLSLSVCLFCPHLLHSASLHLPLNPGTALALVSWDAHSLCPGRENLRHASRSFTYEDKLLPAVVTSQLGNYDTIHSMILPSLPSPSVSLVPFLLENMRS